MSTDHSPKSQRTEYPKPAPEGPQPPVSVVLQRTGLDSLASATQILASGAVVLMVFVAMRELKIIRGQSTMNALFMIQEKISSDKFQQSLKTYRKMGSPTPLGAFKLTDANGQALREIANLYEAVAINVERGHIHILDVERLLTTDLCAYWRRSAGAVKDLQQDYPRAYKDTEGLADQICENS